MDATDYLKKNQPEWYRYFFDGDEIGFVVEVMEGYHQAKIKEEAEVREKLLESINEAEKHDLFNSHTEYFKGCRDGVKASTLETSENEEYMSIRKIIRGFVRWQLEKDMIDPLTIDYEVAEMYLES